MILDPVYWRINDFLSKKELDELWEFIESNKENFVPTVTWSGEKDYRSSKTLYNNLVTKEMYEKWRTRLHELIPEICLNLLHPEFEAADDFEMQIVANNDGDFYKVHSDVGVPIYNSREITFVYYFNRPNSFTNGLRQLYPTDSEKLWSPNVPEEGSVYFKPIHNSIVFFDPRLMHQILPVTCPSKDFMDSNFTINGWIRRKEI